MRFVHVASQIARSPSGLRLHLDQGGSDDAPPETEEEGHLPHVTDPRRSVGDHAGKKEQDEPREHQPSSPRRMPPLLDRERYLPMTFHESLRFSSPEWVFSLNN